MSTGVVRVEDLNAALAHCCDRCRGILEQELTVTSHAKVSDGSIDTLLELFVNEVGTTVECFRGHSQELMPVRRQFCDMARRRGYTLVQIGEAIGRCHTQVMRLCRHAESQA